MPQPARAMEDRRPGPAAGGAPRKAPGKSPRAGRTYSRAAPFWEPPAEQRPLPPPPRQRPRAWPAAAISSAAPASVYDRAMERTKDRRPEGRTGARRAPASLILLLLLAAAAPAAAEIAPPPPRPVAAAAPAPLPDPAAADLFAMPAVAAVLRRALAAAEAGELAGAAALLDRTLAAHPGIGGLAAARAAVAMLEDDPAGALDGLAAAAADGLPDLAAIAADPVFAPLAADPVLGAAPRRPRRQPPCPAAPGRARGDRRRPRPGRRRQHRLEPGERAPRGRLRPAAGQARAGAARPAEDRRPRHPPRALEARPRRRQRRRPLRQPRPRPLGAEARGLPPARPRRLFPRGAGGRDRLRPPGQAALRPPDARQLLDGGDRRPPLAEPPPPRDDPRRRHRPAPPLAERRSQRPLRLSGPQGLDPRPRRPLPGQHPLSSRQPRLLGLGRALPRGRRPDLRELPPRHQGAARRRGAAGADDPDGLPPQPAPGHLARELLQRRRPSGRLRRLHDQPRPHGQPRQRDQGRRHPARGPHRRHRRGARHRGRRLLRRRASPSSSSTRPPPSPASGARRPGSGR